MASWTLTPEKTRLYGIFDLETNEPVTNPSLDEDKIIDILRNLDNNRYVMVGSDATIYRMKYFAEGIKAL